jgi:murein L,D-transpeptidase YcbB/YkuD
MKKKKLAFAAACVVYLTAQIAHAGADSYEVQMPQFGSVDNRYPGYTKAPRLQGHYDANLLNIQERLAVIGYYPTYLVDGQRHAELDDAIKRFQADHQLQVDGIFGTHTAITLNYVTGMLHMVPVNSTRTVYDYRLPGYYLTN